MCPLGLDHVRSLQTLRGQYGPEATKAKKVLLAECATQALRHPRTVLRYHDTLLFLAAYPDDAPLSAAVHAELVRIAEAVPNLLRRTGAEDVLANSGVANTFTDASFSIDLLEWLADRFPDDVRPAWSSGDVGEGIYDLLVHSSLPVERDAILLPRIDMEHWTRFAIGCEPSGRRDLSGMLSRLRRLLPDPDLLDIVLEKADLRVRWHLTPPGPSRTLGRFPDRPAFYQRTAPKRRFDVKRLLGRSLPAPRRRGPRSAWSLIDVARGTLAVRNREADPISYANPQEVTIFSLERGIDIALFGLRPSQRLPVESYFGFMAARNRVPVAYGGAWVFGHRAEIGVHLFQSFRGGESAYLFGQVLRTYRHHYDVERFRVDPYQFGAGNAEAIRSGAFWFYYRFGFRPVDATLRTLAASEAATIRADRTHRTPPAILRRFTKSPIALDLTPRGVTPDDPPQLPPLSVAVSRVMIERFGDDREAAARWAQRRVEHLLRPGRKGDWPEDERSAFHRLCPLVASLPGVETWSDTDRRGLARLMRAKGAKQERDYALSVQRHPRFREALREAVATVDWTAVPLRPARRSARKT